MSDFRPSVNIVRDIKKDFKYIVTKNVSDILDQLLDNHKAGFKVFNIVGSYGTGKSSFLLAIMRTLLGIEKHLKLDRLLKGDQIKVLSVTGAYKSFRDEICNALDVNIETENIISDLMVSLERFGEKNTSLLISVDEFGKFLEYAANNNPEQELFFMQEFAEMVSSNDLDVIVLTTLHQNFDAYSAGLSISQKQEWYKVKGRFKELQFNEPVGNLIYLLKENTKLIESTCDINLNSDDLRVLSEAKICDFSNNFDSSILQDIYPFDPISIVILAKCLQLYGQNERSIFSFVESYDYLGLKNHNTSNGAFYSITSAYDYLFHNFHSYIYNKENPYYLQWAAINKSTERVLSSVYEDRESALKIVKTIGLLNIFADAGAKVDIEFLFSYMDVIEKIPKSVTETVLKTLESKKIIRFLAFKSSYILFEGTDLDIDLALYEASQQISFGVNIVDKLKKYLPYNVEMAKASFLNKGTPRFFTYEVTDIPTHTPLSDEIDGRINIVINDNVDMSEIQKFSKDNKDTVYCVIQDLSEIKQILFEIDKIKSVISNVIDDKVATLELNNMKAFFVSKLSGLVDNIIFDFEKVSWHYKGQAHEIKSKADLNKKLSNISDELYHCTPVLKNELINRTKLSSTISTAWNKLFKRLLTYPQDKDIAFDKTKYPAEKTIYLALLKKTGIHRSDSGIFGLNKPLEASFTPLWNRCEEFLEESKHKEKTVANLIDELQKQPYRLKYGLIEFWVPIFLLAKQNEYAIYEDGAFVPEISLEVLQLIRKSPSKYTIKAFNVTGVRLNLFNKYREMINEKTGAQVTNESFIETIKPFLVFYSGLPEYAKNTNKLSKSTIQFRKSIVFAKDPEQTFFESFPKALGYTVEQLIENEELLERYVGHLQKSISELRSCYQELIERIENSLLDELGYQDMVFEDYKKIIQKRFSSVNNGLLTSHQKVFYTRLYSNIDDRVAWVSSLIQPVLGKKLENMQDDEEMMLIQNLKHILRELDNLREFSEDSIDVENEHVVKCSLTNIQGGLVERTISIPKDKLLYVDELKDVVRKIAKGDEKVRLIALANLLMDELNEYKG
ncbi:hypothetical protein [Limisalsivibrio acetivorans]|uniref:hypothetical protein n=1 Tax=Limisalsivibrio acetivorans TaxID=1304888 RepID=UPI0003B5B90F|nr:hypothetical protein [Limisalsivibrio acetivorans]